MTKTKNPELTMLAYAALAAIRKAKEAEHDTENRRIDNDDRVDRRVPDCKH